MNRTILNDVQELPEALQDLLGRISVEVDETTYKFTEVELKQVFELIVRDWFE